MLFVSFNLHATTEIQVSTFNSELSAWFNGRVKSSPALAGWDHEGEALTVRQNIAKSKSQVVISAKGKWICRAYVYQQFCFTAAFQGERVGLIFENGSAQAYFPVSQNPEDLKKELEQKFWRHFTKTAWSFSLWPKAHADLSDGEIMEMDENLVVATYDGWKRLHKNPEHVLRHIVKSWPSGYLNSNEVSCTPDGVKMTVRRSNLPLEIEKKGDTYFASVNGDRYEVSLKFAGDAKRCEDGFIKHHGLCPRKIYQKRTSKGFLVTGAKNSSTHRACLIFYKSCRYPLPKRLLDVWKCQGSACATELSSQDILKLADASPYQRDRNAAYEDHVLKLAPHASFVGGDVDISQDKDHLSGKALSEIDDLRENIDTAMNEGTRDWESFLSGLQEHVLNAEQASVCCQSAHCRKLLYQAKGIDLIPEPAKTTH